MFARPNHRLDLASTGNLAAVGAADPRLTLLPFSRLDASDALDQLGEADAADHALLRLVVCAALATLALAVASSLGA